MASRAEPVCTRDAPATGVVALLRGNADFRNLWLGEVVSSFGDWFNLIATATLVDRLAGSGSALGGLFAIRMLAPFFASSFAGVLADRHSRRTIMILADLARAAVVLGFLLVRTPGQVWLLYALTAVQLGLSGLFVPARAAILPDLVDRRDLGVANAVSSVTYAVMQTVGAAAGGLLAGLIGVYETFVVDAASFLLSAALIAQVARPTRAGGDRAAGTASAFRQYAEGIRFLVHDGEAAMLSMQKGLNAFFITGGLNILSVSLALRHYPIGQAGSTSVGLTFCATGLGTAIGPVVARRLVGDRLPSLRRGLVWCYLISAAGLATMALATSFPQVLAGMVVRGVGGGMMFVFSSHLLMIRVPEAVRGRVFASEFAIRTLLGAAGVGVFSLAVDGRLGLHGMLWATAAAALVPAALWAGWLAMDGRGRQ